MLNRSILCVALFISVAMQALSWPVMTNTVTVQVGTQVSQDLSIPQGETRVVESIWKSGTNFVVVTNMVADFIYQKENDGIWYTATCTVHSAGVVRLTWGPSYDDGSPRYLGWVRLLTGSNPTYRLKMSLRMIETPGFTPNATAMTVVPIDFGQLTWTNEPWWSTNDFSNADTGHWNSAWSWGNHATNSYLTPSATQSLAGIAAQAANGQTAFGWGNHASSGYLTPAATQGLATVTYVDSATQGLATVVFVTNAINISTQGVAYWAGTTNLVNLSTQGYASVVYVTNILNLSTQGLASWALVTNNANQSTQGLASVVYVTNAVNVGTQGLASVTFVTNAVNVGTQGLASVVFVTNSVNVSTQGLASVDYVTNAINVSTSGLLSVESDPVALAALALVTNGTKGVTLLSNGNLGLGTTSPDNIMNVVDVDQPTVVTIDSYANSGSDRSIVLLRTAHGNEANPSNVVADDEIGEVIGGGYAGGDFRNTARMAMLAENGDISSTSLPSRIIFETTPNGSVTRAERVRINRDGYVGIGTTNPAVALDIVGSGRVSVNATGGTEIVNYQTMAGMSYLTAELDTVATNLIRGHTNSLNNPHGVTAAQAGAATAAQGASADSATNWISTNGIFGRLNVLDAGTNQFIKTNETRTVNLSNATVYVREAAEQSEPVTLRQLGSVIGGVSVLYASTNTTLVPGYYDARTFLPTHTNSIITVAGVTNNQYMAKWVSNTNLITAIRGPSIATITSRMRIQSTAGGRSLTCKPEVYLLHADTTEPELMEVSQTVTLTGTFTDYATEINVPSNIVVLSTDRLVIKWKAVAASGTAPTWEFICGNGLVIAARFPVANANSILTDAPSDGNLYSRKNGTWAIDADTNVNVWATHKAITNILMLESNAFDIGSATCPVRSIYVATNSIHFVGADGTDALTIQGGTAKINGTALPSQSDLATVNSKISGQKTRIDAHSVSLMELAFADSAMQTWAAVPYSQYLADYFSAQTWLDSANSTNILYVGSSDSYQFKQAGLDRAVALNEGGGTTDYITNGVSGFSWGGADWTVSVWAKFVASDGGYIYTMLDSSGSFWLLNLNVGSDGSMTFECGGAGQIFGVSPAGFWSDENWHHVALSYSNSSVTMELWVDGSHILTNTAVAGSMTSVSAKYPFALGSAANVLNSAGAWNGYINELSIHQYAFSDEDVDAVYNGGNGITMATNQLGCKQLLRFEDNLEDSHPDRHDAGSGGTITYSEGNITGSLHSYGVLQSSPWTSSESNNSAAVEVLINKSSWPDATNFTFQLSQDSGATFTNPASWTSRGAWPDSTGAYYRFSSSVTWPNYGSNPVYRAMWTNGETLKLKGVSHYVETIID